MNCRCERCRCECVAGASALQVRVGRRCECVAGTSALQVRVRCRCECDACTSALQVRVAALQVHVPRRGLGPSMSTKAKGGAKRHQAPAQLGPAAACHLTHTPCRPPTHPPAQCHRHHLRRQQAPPAATVAPRSHQAGNRHRAAAPRLREHSPELTSCGRLSADQRCSRTSTHATPSGAWSSRSAAVRT